MTRIHPLDQATVNQIAAGEVVERPASVVKELVENAIDAGAGRVEVEVRTTKSEVTAIRVTDDGVGIAGSDIALALAPHATSKIRTIGDLSTCSTLGFRGEALASIAAVSRVTLTTRPRTGDEGYIVSVLGGSKVDEATCGCPFGTTVLVEDLFFNTPARRKFQRSIASELATITGLIEACALTYPAIRFRLLQNGRERISAGGSDNLIDTAVALYGHELTRDLEIFQKESGDVVVSGYLSRPSLSRPRPYQIITSVNGRIIYSRSLITVIREQYGTLLPRDRYPVACIRLSLDPARVDANVHPTKRVVRFAKNGEVLAAVETAVHEALIKCASLPTDDLKQHTWQHQFPTVPEVREAAVVQYYAVEPHTISSESHSRGLQVDRQLRLTEMEMPLLSCDNTPVRVIGQYEGAYILAVSPTGDLTIVDQHAAHERVLYENLSAKNTGTGESQELLAPVIIYLTPKEQSTFEELVPLIEDEGFKIEPFGVGAYAVRAVPLVLGRMMDADSIRDLIAGLIQERPGRVEEEEERLRRTIACHGAIRAGTPLVREQCERLVSQLLSTPHAATCPHGRPTMITFSRQRLDRMFHRE
jgi:DNA mismatch repair protein MutL